jgi:hypothetical protein
MLLKGISIDKVRTTVARMMHKNSFVLIYGKMILLTKYPRPTITYDIFDESVMERRSNLPNIIEKYWKLREVKPIREFCANQESFPLKCFDELICNQRKFLKSISSLMTTETYFYDPFEIQV